MFYWVFPFEDTFEKPWNHPSSMCILRIIKMDTFMDWKQKVSLLIVRNTILKIKFCHTCSNWFSNRIFIRFWLTWFRNLSTPKSVSLRFLWYLRRKIWPPLSLDRKVHWQVKLLAFYVLYFLFGSSQHPDFYKLCVWAEPN